MDKITDLCGEKRAKYTALAHAVRFAMRCGITAPADLARELQCTPSAVYRAMKQLEAADRTVTFCDRAVKSDRTELTEASKSDRAVTPAPRAPARIESPSGIVITSGGSEESPFTPESRVVLEKGRLVLFNGLKSYWLDRFGGDEIRLDLALTQAAGYVQPNSSRPLEAQVGAQLARIAGEKHDRDQRYAKAATTNAVKPQAVANGKPKSRFSELLDQALAEGVPA